MSFKSKKEIEIAFTNFYELLIIEDDGDYKLKLSIIEESGDERFSGEIDRDKLKQLLRLL